MNAPVTDFAQASSAGALARHRSVPVRIGEGVRVRNVAPKLGQHNAEIFRRLGVSQIELRKLRARGVV